MLVLALLEPGKEGEGIRGTMEVELPLYLDTEAATLGALSRYGWTGTTWVIGEPPPLDDPSLAEQLSGLLSQTTPSLRATLLFAPDPETASTLVQPVEILRAQGHFLMPPLEQPETPPTPERVQALRNLVKAYRTFYPEDEAREQNPL